MPALKSLDTFSSHGSEWKTQKPESRPTTKHEALLLKAADNDTGPVDSSMTGRVFMLVKVAVEVVSFLVIVLSGSSDVAQQVRVGDHDCYTEM